jgi:signal transduction histidine kinase/DNA-binding response OmpR family regulator
MYFEFKNSIFESMKKYLALFIFLLAVKFLSGKNDIDSLKALLPTFSGQERVHLLCSLSKAYRSIDPNEGIKYAEEGLSDAKKIGYLKGEATSIRLIGSNYVILGNYKMAMVNARQALQLLKELENEKLEIAATLNLIGIIYYKISDYDNALEYYLMSLKISEEIEHKKGIANSMNNIGNVYSNILKYEEALKYLLKAYEIKQEIGNVRELATTANNIGIAYAKLSNISKALEYYQISLRLKKENKDYQSYASTLNNMGEMYFDQKNYNEALKYYQEAETTSQKYKNDQLLAMIWMNIGYTYLKLQKLDIALNYLEIGKDQAKKTSAANVEIECYKALSELYSDKGDYKKALEFYKSYTLLRDSVFSKQSVERIANMEQQIEIEKQEKEIENYKITQSIAQLKISRQRLLIYLFVGMGIFVIFIIIYLIHRYQLKNSANLAITTKNNQLRTLADQLQEMDEIKSNFFANISHEFRTPLTLLIGPLTKLIENSKYPGLNKTLKLMLRNAQRQLNLVDQLLDLSKIEAKKMTLKASKGTINKFVKAILSSFYTLAKDKGIELKLIEESNDIEIYFDSDKLSKILSNLISNAIKFTLKKGTIEVILSVEQSSDKSLRPDFFKLIVKDNGIGISEKHLHHIFDRFYQVDTSSLGIGKGTGVGLALTKELVELHRGEIIAKSRKNLGSEFIVKLPMGKDHLAEHEISDLSSNLFYNTKKTELKSNGKSDKKPLADNRSKKSSVVLVVEDNEDMRLFISDCLNHDFKLIEAIDGIQGLDMAEKHSPDLIISDVMMPNMDGFEFTKRIKENVQTSHIPVIILTAKSSDTSKITGFEKGADAYLYKPFNTKELIVRVQKLIEQRQNLRKKFERDILIKPSEITTTSLDENFLRKATKIVENNMDNPDFSVEQFGSEMAMERNTLYRKLMKLIGQSPSQFIRSIRLKRAAQLLNQNAFSIGEIVYMVGFEKHSYFTDCFKKQFGVPPSAFKAKKI